MRQIFLDTETTGLSAENGDRIIEIGCIEMLSRRLSDNHFHRYLNPQRPKYNLKYYIDLAQRLEKMGAHILAIKDMAGLLKPLAAYKLVKALKENIGIPVHLHTHDTSSNGSATLLKAGEAERGAFMSQEELEREIRERRGRNF